MAKTLKQALEDVREYVEEEVKAVEDTVITLEKKVSKVIKTTEDFVKGLTEEAYHILLEQNGIFPHKAEGLDRMDVINTIKDPTYDGKPI